MGVAVGTGGATTACWRVFWMYTNATMPTTIAVAAIEMMTVVSGTSFSFTGVGAGGTSGGVGINGGGVLPFDVGGGAAGMGIVLVDIL